MVSRERAFWIDKFLIDPSGTSGAILPEREKFTEPKCMPCKENKNQQLN